MKQTRIILATGAGEPTVDQVTKVLHIYGLGATVSLQLGSVLVIKSPADCTPDTISSGQKEQILGIPWVKTVIDVEPINPIIPVTA